LGLRAPGDVAAMEQRPEVADPAVDVLPVAFSVIPGDREPATVLRVFRGELLPGELDAYVDDARAGTLADVAAEHGPQALFLGVDPPARFITVSVWGRWDRIEAATGGNPRQPIATRHERRLASWTARHYEILSAATVDNVPIPLVAYLAES
jgi:hypothetical protein